MNNRRKLDWNKIWAETRAKLAAAPLWPFFVALLFGTYSIYEFYQLSITGNLHLAGRIGSPGPVSFGEAPFKFSFYFLVHLYVLVLFGGGAILGLIIKLRKHQHRN